MDAAPNSTDVTDTSVSPNKKTRELLEQEKKDQIIAFKKQQKENEVPQSSAMQVTLIVKVSFSFLPEDLLAKLAVVTIEEHELDLMMMLQEHSNFYTYFKPLNGITSDVVLELTAPPTPEPTTLAFYLANNQEDVPDEDGGFGFGAVSSAFKTYSAILIHVYLTISFVCTRETVCWTWYWISVVLPHWLFHYICHESANIHEGATRPRGSVEAGKINSLG